MQSAHTHTAYIIGAADYQHDIPQLKTPVNDASVLASLLEKTFNYKVNLYTDQVTLDLMQQVQSELEKSVEEQESLLFYFAGHGIAVDNEEGIPKGYLIPEDAQIRKPQTYFPMDKLSEAIRKRNPHHALLILDCCFAGSFSWAPLRGFLPQKQQLTHAKYDYFLTNKSWQLITSASYDEAALDYVVRGFDPNDRERRQGPTDHSPFAESLLNNLRHISQNGTGLMTVQELIVHLQNDFGKIMEFTGNRQMPKLQSLALIDKKKERLKHKGEYIFQSDSQPKLANTPELSRKNNPYKGLESYSVNNDDLFFGRSKATEDLVQKVKNTHWVIVSGKSGGGKSSLVKAGLISTLIKKAEEEWLILPIMRPGEDPFFETARIIGKTVSELKKAFVESWRSYCNVHADKRILWTIDQFEEFFTRLRSDSIREDFFRFFEELLDTPPTNLHIVITIRREFKSQLPTSIVKKYWEKCEYSIPDLDFEEFKEIIEGPASAKSIFFESERLVHRIIKEVSGESQPLPLLSFGLSELYLESIRKRPSGTENSRSILEEDLNIFPGGFVGALWSRADHIYENYPQLEQITTKNIYLRMVSLETGEPVRRRIIKEELVYDNNEENTRVDTVLKDLVDARLIVSGEEDSGKVYYEPAHDRLVEGWSTLSGWIKDETIDKLVLGEKIYTSASDWVKYGKKNSYLWDDLLRLEGVFLPKRKKGVLNNMISAIINWIKI